MLPDRGFTKAFRARAVCVTGGAGFIGSHLVDGLIASGARVTVIDDLSSGLRANLSEAGDGVRLVEGSINDAQSIAEAVRGAKTVFHLAAVGSVPRSVEHPRLAVNVNTMGTLEVLEAARAAGVNRVVYAASSSAYGDQPVLPKVETMAPDARSPYAASKCASEHLMRAYAHCYDLDTVSLRYFNIFGPRQRVDSAYAAVVPLFIDALAHGKTPTIYGDGSQTRDFTYVANAVYANLLAGACDGELRGEVLNVAAGGETSVLQMLEAIAERLGVEPRCAFAPPRSGEVAHSVAGLARSKDVLGYEPAVTFEEGLRETIAAARVG